MTIIKSDGFRWQTIKKVDSKRNNNEEKNTVKKHIVEDCHTVKKVTKFEFFTEM